jgi:GNAT superfamily N-acetyltransferase
MRIQIVESDAEIDACYPVMAELRPHLARDAFVAQVKRQRETAGYALVAGHDPGVVAVAGIRIAEWLPSGKCLEIEDLVTHDGERSKGYGAQLFDWIAEHARREGCAELKLVSHVTRFDAHRFYLNRGMSILAHFFSLKL